MSDKRKYTIANYLSETEQKVLYYILFFVVCGLILKVSNYIPQSGATEVAFVNWSEVIAEDDFVYYDLNTVSFDELLYVSGIGPATADAILQYRQVNSFESVDDLINVRGIGEVKLANFRQHFFVEGETDEIAQVVSSATDQRALQRFLSAGLDDLVKVNGIGQRTAETIIQYRSQNTISRFEDLLQISGIGQKRLENIIAHFSVATMPSSPQDIKTTNDTQYNMTKININTATHDQLITLSGIGVKRADDIIAYRTATGGFTDIKELLLVPGIGTKTFDRIKDFICIGE